MEFESERQFEVLFPSISTFKQPLEESFEDQSLKETLIFEDILLEFHKDVWFMQDVCNVPFLARSYLDGLAYYFGPHRLKQRVRGSRWAVGRVFSSPKFSLVQDWPSFDSISHTYYL